MSTELKEDFDYEVNGRRFRFYASTHMSFPKQAIAEIEFANGDIEEVSYTFLTREYYRTADDEILNSLEFNVNFGVWASALV